MATSTNRGFRRRDVKRTYGQLAEERDSGYAIKIIQRRKLFSTSSDLMRVAAPVIFWTIIGLSCAFLPLSSRTAVRWSKSVTSSSTSFQMKVVDVSSAEQLDNTLKEAGSSLVIIDYSTTWCGPCKVIEPKFVSLSEDYSNVIFLKVMGDENADTQKLMKREGVRSVPSFHFWKEGTKVLTVNGANSAALEEGLKEHA